MREIIEERKSSTSADGNDHSKNGGGGKGDFLDVIMGMAEGPSSPGLDEEEQVSIVLDILLGGYETTATLLSLIVYFLSHSPLVLQTLKVIHRPLSLKCHQSISLISSVYFPHHSHYGMNDNTEMFDRSVSAVHTYPMKNMADIDSNVFVCRKNTRQ